MNQHVFLILSILISFSTCTSSHDDLLSQSKKKIYSSQSVKYRQSAHYPNPMGDIDTAVALLHFSKSDSSIIGNDFIFESKYVDEIYIDGKYKRVNKRDEVITIYTELDTQAFKDGIINSNYIKYSPLSLLNLTDWVFVNDTLMEDESFSNFKKVEADTIVNGNKIYTELHIFINISSKQLLRFERRNYFNDNPAQIVLYEYTAYDYDKRESKFAYTDPLDFSSVVYGQSTSKVSLSVGQKAPEFLAGDLNGNIIDMKKNLGKKVLLNFSIINCGYCKDALNHFNQESFILANNITAVYINPIDERKRVKDYATKFNVPFPVIANANEIGVMYGINAYPTFVLINEEGFIEDIIVGYEEDFIEGLNKS